MLYQKGVSVKIARPDGRWTGHPCHVGTVIMPLSGVRYSSLVLVGILSITMGSPLGLYEISFRRALMSVGFRIYEGACADDAGTGCALVGCRSA